MHQTSQQLITTLGLEPHPEGGYFKETYRSEGTISQEELGDRYRGNRNYSTGIYFLLTSDQFSALHRIKQDEVWHFYDGSPLKLHMITPEGKHSEHLIGRDLTNGETPQFMVPGGCWFGAEVINPDSYSFVGCTVAPGFDFTDFELGNKHQLTTLFPNSAELIERLTHQ
jgi:predicted cupin superfamily sugar epimerase